VELNALVDQRDSRIRELEQEMSRSRERIEREAQKDAEQVVRRVLVQFLDVLDDLDRAIAAARSGQHAVAVLEGIELVRKRFLSKLQAMGIEHRPALGERFDPNLHEAVATVPVRDAAQDNRIIDVLQEGYAIGDDLLRPARVAVGKRS
jgi:molecular chaperone GrpE